MNPLVPIAVFIVFPAIAAIGLGIWIWKARFATYHFAAVHPGILYRSGNRGMREFARACRRGNIRTVVMLIGDKEAQKERFKSEVEFCRQQGIKLERIPALVGQRPDTEQVQRFLEIATDPPNHPVLTHCAQGVRRTAMMAAAYQRSILGYDVDQTKQAILPWGRKWERLDDIRGFIDDYDPTTRTVGSAHVVIESEDGD